MSKRFAWSNAGLRATVSSRALAVALLGGGLAAVPAVLVGTTEPAYADKCLVVFDITGSAADGADDGGHSANIACGHNASATGHGDNSAFGTSSNANGEGANNTALGYNAHAFGTSSHNTSVGGSANSAGDASINTAIGDLATAYGASSGNVAVGDQAQSQGDLSHNLAIGAVALSFGQGSANIASGFMAAATSLRRAGSVLDRYQSRRVRSGQEWRPVI